MAGFVDCTKYNKEQQEQDTRIDNLEKREIAHDETLKGGGIDEKSPLGLNTSNEKDNAIKTDKNGVYVKDLEPQVEKLEEALKNKYDRLGNDLEARIRELNGRLNALKDIEVALAAAKAEGNYNKIKELEARLQAAKEAQQTGDKGLAEAIEALRKQGLTDEQIRKIIDDAVAKAGGTGRYITRIETNQNDGTVTYYYSDGTSATGKLANFGVVVADQRTIVGNGHDQALRVQLSKLSDNKLQVVDDGLYIGDTMKQPFLYVTRDGNDDNIGTREKPMRTLEAALARIDPAYTGRFAIYLKENEDFDVRDAHQMNGTLELRAYGDVVDNTYPFSKPGNLYYRGYTAVNYPRPSINFRMEVIPSQMLVRRGSISATNEIVVYGMKVNAYNKVENDNPAYSGYIAGVFNTRVLNLNGVILREATKGVAAAPAGAGAYRVDVMLRANEIYFQTCKIANISPLFSSNYTASVKLTNFVGGDDGTGHYDFESILGRNNWLEDAVTNMKSSAVLQVDKERKLTFGTTFTHDLFEVRKSEEWNHWS